MNDESNALRKFSPLEIWFSWQHSSLQDSPMFCNAEAALAQIESLTREKAKLVASRDAYKRDAEGLLYVGRATVDALETTEAEVKTLRSELDAAKRNVAAKYFFFLQNRGETDETTRQLHELVKLLNKEYIDAHGARCEKIMVGCGTDTYDPICTLPKGHSGKCLSTSALHNFHTDTDAENKNEA